MATARTPLSKDDVHDICMALPGVELGTSWGDVPTYLVGGKGFVRFRKPHKSAVDDNGELMDDVIVIDTSSPDEGRALVESDLPFFTIEHFRSHPASVLIRERDLDHLDYVELAEVLTDAWAGRAPKKLVKEHLG
jgi:hypothetical protein